MPARMKKNNKPLEKPKKSPMKSPKNVNGVSKLPSQNFVHWNFLHSLGSTIPKSLNKSLNVPLMNLVKAMRVDKSYDGFKSRVTAVCWHPNEKNTVAVGSKIGDIIVWNHEEDNLKPRLVLKGSGPGGSILSFRFDERNNGNSLYVVSMDGGVSLKHLNRGGQNCPEEKFAWTDSVDDWYTSLGVSFENGVMAAGNNKGLVNLFTIDGKSQWTKRLHSKKVTHVEFSSKDSWCFVSSSVDRTVKVWDVRKIKDKNSNLFTLEHDFGVNSACFSRMHGGMLLTTDQKSQLRTYSCPSFNLNQTINHPHRHFQHLTPIKASWHPLLDIAVVGRYPDPDFGSDDLRCIDFYDANSGQNLHQLVDPQTGNKINSLNEFNRQGDRLLSCYGSAVHIWKPHFSDSPLKKEESSSENGNSTRRPPGKENKRKELRLDASGAKRKL